MYFIFENFENLYIFKYELLRIFLKKAVEKHIYIYHD